MWGAVSLWLICISLTIKDVEHLLTYVSFFEEHLFRSAHLKIRLFVFVIVKLFELFIYFWILTPYHIYDLQVFSPISPLKLPFHFVDCFLYCAEAFWFDVAPLIYFCFCCFCIWSQIQRAITKTYVSELITMFSSRALWFRVLCSSLYLSLNVHSYFVVVVVVVFNPVSCFHRITTLHTWLIKILILIF